MCVTKNIAIVSPIRGFKRFSQCTENKRVEKIIIREQKNIHLSMLHWKVKVASDLHTMPRELLAMAQFRTWDVSLHRFLPPHSTHHDADDVDVPPNPDCSDCAAFCLASLYRNPFASIELLFQAKHAIYTMTNRMTIHKCRWKIVFPLTISQIWGLHAKQTRSEWKKNWFTFDFCDHVTRS